MGRSMMTDNVKGRYSAVLLPVIPVLFVLFTYLIIYITVLPAVRPYIDLAGLFLYDMPQTAAAPRNLFSPPAAGGGAAQVQPELPRTSSGIPVSKIVKPNHGDLYGRLTIEGTSVDAPVYWNDSETELNLGVGTYTGGWLPGFGRTVMMAGHRTTDLKDLGRAQIGGTITVETHYETYTYEITDIAVYHMNDSSAYDFGRKDENIIIYTCYPFDYVGAARERYFVYGELTSGTQVDRQS